MRAHSGGWRCIHDFGIIHLFRCSWFGSASSHSLYQVFESAVCMGLMWSSQSPLLSCFSSFRPYLLLNQNKWLRFRVGKVNYVTFRTLEGKLLSFGGTLIYHTNVDSLLKNMRRRSVLCGLSLERLRLHFSVCYLRWAIFRCSQGCPLLAAWHDLTSTA